MDPGVFSKANAASGMLLEELSAIQGVSAHSAVAADCVCGVRPRVVVEPRGEREVARALKFATGAGLAVIPRGGGTKLDWGNAPKRADIILSMARLDKVVEHAWADLTVTAEAGCTIQKLQEAVARHGQRLALDPLWPERATVGGVLSTNDSGALRLRFGALRDLVIGATLALSDGTLAISGGKVVKNVAGYDLQKLATGALGSLGVITRATFRLHPLPRHSLTFTISAANRSDAQRLMLAIQDSKLAHASLQLRAGGASDDAAHGPATQGREGAPELDVLLEGTEAGVRAQAAQLATIAAPARTEESATSVWKAREELWSAPGDGASVSPDSMPSGTKAGSDDGDSRSSVGGAGFAPTVARSGEPFVARAGDFSVIKISILPASVASMLNFLSVTSAKQNLSWRAVIQATGIAWIRLEGNAGPLAVALQPLREEVERNGGSLVAMQRSAGLSTMDAWGTMGDALALMRAVKSQFDPAGTLNPGRFAGGI